MTQPNPHLLHVENDSLVARSVRRVLRRSGFSVESASSCAGAHCARPPAAASPIESRALRVGGRAFKWGVFDIDLDDGNGVELAAQLLAQGRVAQVCFFSGSSDPATLARATQLGHVIRKAAGVGALVSLLKAAGSSLRKAPAPSSAAHHAPQYAGDQASKAHPTANAWVSTSA